MKKNFILLAAFTFLLGLKSTAQFTPTYTGKPIYEILTKRGGVTLGIIKVELYPTIAYHHVKNFDSLVSVLFYDTTAFHRAIPNFMIQGGDPNSRHGAISTWGIGQAGQPTVNAEFTLAKNLRGRLAAARSTNINSATSQFYINVVNNPNLDGNYTVYGNVISGMNFADTIALCPKMTSYTNTPLQKVEMFITRVGSNDTIQPAPTLIAPATNTLNVDTAFAIQLKWNAVPGNMYYHLDVSKNPSFTSDTIKSQDLIATTFNLNNLRSGTTYCWRVFSNNGGHVVSSEVRNLSTISLEPEGTAEILTLSKQTQQTLIYPNPSNGKFNFTHLEKGNTLEIFDLNGKLILERSIQETDISLDLEGKEKGLYFYKISNNKKEVQQGKLILK